MGVLEKDSSDPFRDWKKKHVVAERGGPVGHGETDAFARDHSPSTDEKERGDGGEPDETVQPPIGVLADRGRGTGIRFVGRHRTNLAAIPIAATAQCGVPAGLGAFGGSPGFASGSPLGFAVFGAPGGVTVPGVGPTGGSPGGRSVGGGTA